MTGPQRAVVEARGVVVRRGGRPVVDRVDLDILPATVTALVGPNGAGKSTLLSVIAGDVEPDEGAVLVDGTPLAKWRPRDLARTRAMLPQEHQVAFGFRVAEVVALGRSPWRGLPEEDHDEEVVLAAMASTDVSHLAERSFPTLSGGEKARTALARTRAQSTRIMLLDEPTAALDIGHQEEIMGQVRQEAADGSAVVVVLHDLSLAAAYADRVVVLDEGRVRADGPPAVALEADLLSSVYRHPLEVITHPTTGALLVIPQRAPAYSEVLK
ncbi:heme ABC transporter ATP-binding protein [Nocardioides massiliensis]|uniref:Iron complex transport system ATP-binding protein n=1 Tax=Nocardioides massiliensis TaxID=1325935 RepID=A0ABT9NRL7_9ACTN|nr:heme ABC transporter ATP-binding protein [Nocardioides massiliensis]MDP9823075.1 iron complex transport system ATP-binding protein [Nocardioides massiliensis]